MVGRFAGAPDAGRGAVLHFTGAEAAGENPENRDGAGGGAVRGCRGRAGGRSGCASGGDAGNSWRVLVYGESFRVHLCVLVDPVYVSALPVRPADAAGVEISDSAGAGERDWRGRGDCAAAAMGLGADRVVDTDDAWDAGRGDVAGER